MEGLRREQAGIRETIGREEEENSQLVGEYGVKKEGLEGRKRRLDEFKKKIGELKEKIETQYCPESYRKHLAQAFSHALKNQALRSQLKMLQNELKKVEGEARRVRKTKGPPATFTTLGRSSYTKKPSPTRLTQSFISGTSIPSKRLTTHVSRASPERSWQFRSVSLG